MGKKTKDFTVTTYIVLLVSSLYTECMAQQLNNNAQFINSNSFSNDNSAQFRNGANTFGGSQFPVQQSTLNTYAPVSPGLYDVGTISKGYSDRPTPGVLGSYINQPVHGDYWSGQAAQYQQYPSPYPYGYQQYPYQQQYYAQQFGYQHTGYNAYNDQYPAFDPRYWAGGPVMQQYSVPVYQGGPMYQRRYPVYGHYHGTPYHPYYHHPGPYHYPAYRQQNKGFLGGTGRGLAKGLLGAALVGVIAGKVARG